MTTGLADLDHTNTGDAVTPTASVARRVLVEAALLGVLADAALRQLGGGLGWTLWVAALAFAVANMIRRTGKSVTGEQTAWLSAAVACAAAFAWRDAEELRAWNVMATLVAFGLFAMSAAGVPAPSILLARVRDVIAAGVYMVRDLVFGAPMLAAVDARLHTLPAVRGGASWSAVRALLLAAPLVLVFTVLLSRADPVFAGLFAFPALDVERVASHVVLAGAFAWWSAGFIRGSALGVAKRWTIPDRMPVRLGSVEVGVALGAVISLFTVFVALQVRWLFGGADVVLATTGLTLAEYARKGFFELVMVTALVIPLILVTGAAIEDDKVARLHRQLSLALVVLLGAIMASALMRMRLYVGYFGLTTDRLYALAIMAWLGMVLVAMAATVLRGWSRPFAAMAAISGFVTLFVLNAVNPELLVARVNLSRDPGARGIDYEYLARMNGDATPAVVAALSSAEPSLSSCRAARHARARWAGRTESSWNLGERRGRLAVVEKLRPTEVLRLCEGIPMPAEPSR